MQPVVSVVVPAYRSARTLRACVDALLAQVDCPPYEIIVVASGSETGATDLPPDRALRVSLHDARLPAAVARNAGVALSRGDLIAFTDADAEAEPRWLAGLIAASGDGGLVAAGSVVNGTPRSAAGTAEYLIEFLDLHPSRPPRTAWHGATCNLLVPRPLWKRYGPFVEDLDGGEDTLLTTAAREDGVFVFAGDARVVHRNRTSLAVVLAHQRAAGRFTARLARRAPYYKLRPVVRYWPLAPFAVAMRFVSVYARAMAWMRGGRLWAVAVAPFVLAGLGAWGVGLAVEGYRLARRVK